jgi:hypothetical protein
MKKVDATLSVTIDLECPHCDHSIDVFNDDEFDYWKCEGGLHFDAFEARSNWGNDNLNKEVKCSSCHESFIIETIQW